MKLKLDADGARSHPRRQAGLTSSDDGSEVAFDVTGTVANDWPPERRSKVPPGTRAAESKDKAFGASKIRKRSARLASLLVLTQRS